jgi:two-component system, chemotaxis family, chemotaxis protein CheY
MNVRRMENIRVLVVDDNQHMIQIVKTLLRGFGMKELYDARDPVDAFDVLRQTPVDIIITDFAMSPINGCEFIRLVRTANDSPNRLVPIIMLSAYSERSKVEAARDVGVNEFCAKPVTANELYRKLCSIVNSARPFVRTSVYFGPDRRRRKNFEYEGEERREGLFGPRTSAPATAAAG